MTPWGTILITRVVPIAALLFLFSPPILAGEKTTIYNFATGEGATPLGGLVFLNNELYGVTQNGGLGASAETYGAGTAYQITTNGHFQTFYLFGEGNADGSGPAAGLSNIFGALYGATSVGGTTQCDIFGTMESIGCGTVYWLNPSVIGFDSIVYRFQQYGPSDGANPNSPVVGFGGGLFGTTFRAAGGSDYGSVYVITPGFEKVLHYFQGGADGAFPTGGALVGLDGDLFGETFQGGGSNACGYNYGCGTVFSTTTSGKEAVLHSFTGGADGSSPIGGLVSLDGVLYGVTYGGGTGNYGTIFSITPQGNKATLYSFMGGADGALPSGTLIYVGGLFYGTTSSGGYMGHGTVYSVTPSGQETVVYAFKGGIDGSAPTGGLTFVGGKLYGTTSQGGTSNGLLACSFGCGTVFQIAP